MGFSIRTILLFALVLFMVTTLPACATREVIVHKTTTVFIEPPTALLKDCEFARPPEKAKYIASTAEQKEELLANYGKDQTNALRLCNVDKKSAREWVVKEKANQQKLKEATK